MLLRQVRSEGLAHFSYMLGDGGEAAVVDPRRDVDVYLKLARNQDLAVTAIFETHRNEDYVVGSRDLARATGADIYHGSAMDFSYGTPVREGDTFSLGTLRVSILETPGHTEESISLVVTDTAVDEHHPVLAFTGDVLFAGDVGRTDFFGPAHAGEMAGKLYDSIWEKLVPLGDGAIICPAHGQGSVCGGNIARRELTTIGYEKTTNQLLQLDRNAFITRKAAERHYYPPYFRQMEEYNKNGAPPLPVLPQPTSMKPEDVRAVRDGGGTLLDIRSPGAFAAGHIPGSLNIWRKGLPMFAGWFLAYGNDIAIVDDFNLQTEEPVRYLIRLGFSAIAGVLAGGFSTWTNRAHPVETVARWSVHALHERLGDGVFVLDVRGEDARVRDGHIPGAHHAYVGHLPEKVDEVPRDRPVIVYCETGFKTGIAASLLKRAGYEEVIMLAGGMQAWQAANLPVERA
jgi:hydroxyacylglutathione hydrolase